MRAAGHRQGFGMQPAADGRQEPRRYPAGMKRLALLKAAADAAGVNVVHLLRHLRVRAYVEDGVLIARMRSDLCDALIEVLARLPIAYTERA